MLRAKTVDYLHNVDVQNGDFIFQHLPGPLTRMIVDVSQGIYSHCGMVVEKGGKWYVLEAIGPVKETPANEWIARGIGGRFTLVRMKPQYRPQLPRILEAAYRYLGRPYDVQYEWDDIKIYCSELIYKAVLEGAGLSMAGFVRLGDLKWQLYEKEIRHLDGGDLPLERRMITPDALAFSEYVETVYSSFSASQTQRSAYKVELLEGDWQGNFTLFGSVLPVVVTVDPRNSLGESRIPRGGLGELSFKESRLQRFENDTGEFRFFLKTQQAIDITLEGRLDHSLDSVHGVWKDQLGFHGTFHLSKTH